MISANDCRLLYRALSSNGGGGGSVGVREDTDDMDDGDGGRSEGLDNVLSPSLDFFLCRPLLAKTFLCLEKGKILVSDDAEVGWSWSSWSCCFFLACFCCFFVGFE
jgi:hypothetical protein